MSSSIGIKVYPPDQAFCIQGHGRPQADVGYDTIDGEQPQKIKLLVDDLMVHEWDYKGVAGSPYETQIIISLKGQHTLSTMIPNQETAQVTIEVYEETGVEKVRFKSPIEGEKFKVGQPIPISIEVYTSA